MDENTRRVHFLLRGETHKVPIGTRVVEHSGKVCGKVASNRKYRDDVMGEIELDYPFWMWLNTSKEAFHIETIGNETVLALKRWE